MKPIHNGKTPNKLSYAWWNTQALIGTAFNEENKASGKPFALNITYAAGAFAATSLIPSLGVVGAVATLGMFPLISGIVTAGLIATGAYFGLQAYHSGKIIKASSSFKNFIKNKEQKWKELKSGPNFKKRMIARIAKTVAFFSYTAALASTAITAATALVTNGLVTSPLIAGALTSVAAVPVTLGLTATALALPTMLTITATAAIVTLGTAVGLNYIANKVLADPKAVKIQKKSFFSGISLKGTKAGNDNSSKPAFESSAPKATKVVKPQLEAEALARKQRRTEARKANS